MVLSSQDGAGQVISRDLLGSWRLGIVGNFSFLYISSPLCAFSVINYHLTLSRSISYSIETIIFESTCQQEEVRL